MTVLNQMNTLFANTYALYLKSQNYHWHVRGIHFHALHAFFETHYQALALAVDAMAERIIMLGGEVPATFETLQKSSTFKPGNSKNDASSMLSDLLDDHRSMKKLLLEAIHAAQSGNDEGTVALLSERLSDHEKTAWMIQAHLR